MAEQKLKTIAAAASELGLAPITLRTWISKRKISCVRLGRSLRIQQSEIEKLIAQGTIPALPERSAR